jgi:hypothetical protein
MMTQRGNYSNKIWRKKNHTSNNRGAGAPRTSTIPEVSPKPCASTLSFGLVLLEYFLLEKRCLLSIPLILPRKKANRDIAAGPLRCRYDAHTVHLEACRNRHPGTHRTHSRVYFLFLAAFDHARWFEYGPRAKMGAHPDS